MSQRAGFATVFLIATCLPGVLCGSGQESVDSAISLAVAAEYEEALRIFSARLREDPENPLLNYYVGISHYKLDHLSEALFHFEKALEEEAEFPQVYFWATKAYLQKDMPDRARQCLSEGRRRFPRNKDLEDLATSVGDILAGTIPGESD